MIRADSEKQSAHAVIAMVTGQTLSEVLRSWVEGQIFPSRMRHILKSYGWEMAETGENITVVPSMVSGVVFSQVEGFRSRKWIVVTIGKPTVDPLLGEIKQLQPAWNHQFYKVWKTQPKFEIEKQETIPGVFISNENNNFHLEPVAKETEVHNATVSDAVPAFDLAVTPKGSQVLPD